MEDIHIDRKHGVKVTVTSTDIQALQQPQMETVSIIVFCLGIAREEFTRDVFSRTANNFSVCSQLSSLRYLRALCMVSNMIIKCYNLFHLSSDITEPFVSLMRFPAEVMAIFGEKRDNILYRSDWTVKERHTYLRSAIMVNVQELIKWLPEEPWVAIVPKMFQFPPVSEGEEFDKQIREFAKIIVENPYRVWVNPAIVDKDIFSTDSYLISKLCNYGTIDFSYSDHRNRILRYTRRDLTFPDRIENKENKPILEDVPAVCRCGVYEQAIELNRHMTADGSHVAVIDAQNFESSDYALTFLKFIITRYKNVLKEIFIVEDGTEITTWPLGDDFYGVSVKHIPAKRIRRTKSVVDTVIISHVCNMFYSKVASNFLILSGDCDFIELHKTIKDANFCFAGMSDAVSFKTCAFLEKCGKTMILLDVFLKGVQEEDADTIEADRNFMEAFIQAATLTFPVDILFGQIVSSLNGYNLKASEVSVLLKKLLEKNVLALNKEGLLYFKAISD